MLGEGGERRRILHDAESGEVGARVAGGGEHRLIDDQHLPWRDDASVMAGLEDTGQRGQTPHLSAHLVRDVAGDHGAERVADDRERRLAHCRAHIVDDGGGHIEGARRIRWRRALRPRQVEVDALPGQIADRVFEGEHDAMVDAESVDDHEGAAEPGGACDHPSSV